MKEKSFWIALNMIRGVGPLIVKRLLDHFGSPRAVLSASSQEIEKIPGLGKELSVRISRWKEEVNLKEEIRLIKEYGVRVITCQDGGYPSSLKEIYDPPPVLYVKGELVPQDDLALAIVGSRRASIYGLVTAEKFGFQLAAQGFTVVSGLARGIDTAAHRGALKAGGRTIAVLGNGLLHIYPPENANLSREIVRKGAIISEFSMNTPPDRGNFPRRNRIISGLSLGVVVVEAARKSGALITADLALEQGKEVFAVPGNINSLTTQGTNKLIQQGAKLVQRSEDIIEELPEEVKGLIAGKGKEETVISKSLSPVERAICDLLNPGPRHIDELAQGAGIPVPKVSQVLLHLELKGIIQQLPGKKFIKNQTLLSK